MPGAGFDRAEELLAQLTHEEKVALLAGSDRWSTVPIERHGIPRLTVTDGPNGARGGDENHGPTSACFPAGAALAATWDVDLVGEVGAALADETRSKGAHVLLAPTVNIQRYPRGGRVFECYSEDPYLTGRMAVAFISGVQSRGVGACIKHFVCNDAEFERRSMSSDVEERPLREVYLAPFETAVAEAGPWSAMSGYNRINGVYAAEHPLLLDVLKGEWGFDGIVMSDWGGTNGEATPAGGLDLEMPGPARWMAPGHVEAALARGDLDEAGLDDKVRRLLRLMVRTGALDASGPASPRADDRPEHRILARRAAAESIVVLGNRDGILPLDPAGMRRVVVVGDLAAHTPIMGGGSAEVNVHYSVPVLDGIREAVGPGTVVDHQVGTVVHVAPPPLASSLVTAADGAPGFTIEYFTNPDLAGEPIRAFTTGKSRFHWRSQGDGYVEYRQFSARLHGTFTPALGGEHLLTLGGIGGEVRLTLDGERLLAGGPDPEQAPTDLSVALDLGAGESHELVVEFAATGESRFRMLEVGHRPPQPDDLVARAVAAAAAAEVAVVVVGLGGEWEGESFDRPDLKLPGAQDELVAAVAAANPATVVLVAAGAPVEMPWADEVAAVAQLWYGGQEVGHAAADVLFGRVDASGRLPMTFPRRLEDAPVPELTVRSPGHNVYEDGVFVGYRAYDRDGTEPRYPFGHGLSYTTFGYRDLAVVAAGDGLQVAATIENTGDRAGAEVVQLYVGPEARQGDHPPQELKGFRKIRLEPGESTTIGFEVTRRDLSWYGPEGWQFDPGEYEVRLGHSSRDIRLTALIEVPAAG